MGSVANVSSEAWLAADDREATRSEVAAVLPSQFFMDAGGAALPGEKRLMIAVLGEAIDTFLKHRRSVGIRGRLLFAEASRWIADTDAGWLFSFERVCEALDLDAQRVRRWVRASAEGPCPRRGWHRTAVTRRRMAHPSPSRGGDASPRRRGVRP
jgi:hypothetical protein